MVDQEKAAANGISTETIARSLQVALNGAPAGLVHMDREKEPVEIFLRMPLEQRADLNRLLSLTVQAPSGRQVPLAELVRCAAAAWRTRPSTTRTSSG